MTGHARDRGAVLPLVLVLIVIAGFVVVPLMTYATSVLKANSVVSQRTKQLEAAKGGLRAALSDPLQVFETCVGPNRDLDPEPTVNGFAVDNQCWLVDDVGSIEALGGEIPIGSVALQLGQTIPPSFITGVAGSLDAGAATTTDWWVGSVPPATQEGLPVDSTVWMPHLPRVPGSPRSAEPFDMPAAYDCQVYFPGRYADPLDLSPANPDIDTDKIYFASGVYYFEQPITVSGDIDVVVGYGLEDFATNCADDLQVAANVIDGPATFAIDGGGATWVLGSDARIVVDDTVGSPSLRFNQRYAGGSGPTATAYEGYDRGRRVNILSVNGDARTPGTDHGGDAVDYHPSFVPRSQAITNAGAIDPNEDGDNSDDVAPTIEPVDATAYVPTSLQLTDAVRAPEIPSGFAFNVQARRYDDGGTPTGALLVEWDHLTGNSAGGAPLSGYEVAVVESGTSTPVGDGCEQADLVFAGDRVSCLLTGLTIGQDYDIAVAGINPFDTGVATVDSSAVAVTPTATSDESTAPAAPSNVAVGPSDVAGDARVTWDAPADDGGAPITGYAVSAQIVPAPLAQEAPIAPPATFTIVQGAPTDIRLPAHDANGDTLEITNVAITSGNPAEWTLPVTPTAPEGQILTTGPVGTTTTITYDVSDGTSTVSGSFDVTVEAAALPNTPPVVATPDAVYRTDQGVPLTVRAAVTDPEGGALSVALDPASATPAVDLSEWTVPAGPTSPEFQITTTADPGSYTIPFTVTDDGGLMTAGDLVIEVRGNTDLGDVCAVATPPSLTAPITIWEPVRTTCDTVGLTPLDPGDQGYLFTVRAINAIGESAGETSTLVAAAPDGSGSPDLWPDPAPTYEVYDPEAIIEVLAGGTGTATLFVPGYVSVPMSKVSIVNPDGDPVSLTGGVLAGQFDVDDVWTVPQVTSNETPIGFWDQVILQRTVRIVSSAGNARSIAVVQVDENGEKYAINTWSVQ